MITEKHLWIVSFDGGSEERYVLTDYKDIEELTDVVNEYIFELEKPNGGIGVENIRYVDEVVSK